jgi:hypothetical protein
MKSIIKIIVVLGVIGTTSSIFARPLRLDFYSESSYVRNNSWIGFISCDISSNGFPNIIENTR